VLGSSWGGQHGAMEDAGRAVALAALARERTALLVRMLHDLGVEELLAPSELPSWSRLTIVCHLRYGASALLRMTRDALAGRPTSYYPHGRAEQRPSTLVPRRGEESEMVVSSLAVVATELDAEWARLGEDDWSVQVVEPADNPDLGSVSLGRLAMSRLLEVDVHGTDLGIGFPDWSDTLVEVALPTRIAWLAVRRTNHREFNTSVRGSWVLAPDDGPSWLIAVDGARVTSRPALASDEPTATMKGSSRDLLALLLGRAFSQPLFISGDAAFASTFSDAFPGP
jgi:uncharacterized protein (TIGR03083 family)